MALAQLVRNRMLMHASRGKTPIRREPWHAAIIIVTVYGVSILLAHLAVVTV